MRDSKEKYFSKSRHYKPKNLQEEQESGRKDLPLESFGRCIFDSGMEEVNEARTIRSPE